MTKITEKRLLEYGFKRDSICPMTLFSMKTPYGYHIDVTQTEDPDVWSAHIDDKDCCTIGRTDVRSIEEIDRLIDVYQD